VLTNYNIIFFFVIKNIGSENIQKIKKEPIKIKFIPGFITYAFMTYALLYFVLNKAKINQQGIPNINYKDAFILGLSIYISSTIYIKIK
jgi:hypothetical protein